MKCPFCLRLARPRRFERPTPAFGGQYSIQLSYERLEGAKYSFFRPFRPSIPRSGGLTSQRKNTANDDQGGWADGFGDSRGFKVLQRGRDETFLGQRGLVN